MTNLFRKIRKKLLSEEKIWKYLKYAFGEIVLIVIGILIAIQVNNYNEKHQYKNAAIEHLEILKQDLIEDSIAIDNLTSEANTQLQISERLLNNFKLIHPVNDTTMSDMVSLSFEFNFKLNRKGLMILINSGEISHLELKVQNLITSFYDVAESIIERENLSNNFIRDKYESYVFNEYSYIFRKGNPLPILAEFYKNDKREPAKLQEEKFIKDSYFESLVTARKYQILKQLEYYYQAQNLIEKIIDEIDTKD